VTCWAKSGGGCSPDTTREHLVSKGLWLSRTLQVSGYPWCRDTPKQVGLGSLTSRILCRAHNNALSPLDQAAKESFQAFRLATTYLKERSAIRPRHWKIRRLESNGPLLERWFLKTAINLAAIGNEHVGWAEPAPDDAVAPPLFVRAVLGLESLPPPMGMYFGAFEGEQIEMADEFRFTARLGANREILGAVFSFRGPRFLLHLTRQDPGAAPVLPLAVGERSAPTRVQFHAPRIDFKVDRWVSHYLDFMWQTPDATPQ